MKNIKLLVSSFKAYDDIPEKMIVPVSAGAALYDKTDVLCELRDNTGINISEKNPQYCELTVQYWAWKNLGCDVCGIMHRRRYFDFSHGIACDYQSHQPRKLPVPYRISSVPDRSALDRFQLHYDVVSALMEQYDWIAASRENIFLSVRDYYDKHDRRDFDDMELVLKVISEKYPAYENAAVHYLNSTFSYFCNMFLSDKKLFDDYSRWLFDVLGEYEKQKPEQLRYPREQGKIAERLFGIYMTYIKEHTGIRWAEIPRVHFAKVDGATPKNMSFNPFLYHLFPPGSFRRGTLRKFI